MRSKAFIWAAAAAGLMAAGAIAQAPRRPSGNFGGGAVVPPPRPLFGAGNAVVGLRALPGGKLDVEATVRANCPGAPKDARVVGADVVGDARIAADGSFKTSGTQTSEPDPGVTLKTRYTISGTFTSATAVDGRLSATITRRSAGGSRRCRSGAVAWGARRPGGDLGTRGARASARYYGTTSQRAVGTRRAIVLRTSSDGRLITRGLFSEFVTCRDGKRSSGVEAPRTNIALDAAGRVSDRERFKIDNGATETRVDDRFTATFGEDGATGTFSLSDRTVDKSSGRTVQRCRSGTVRWKAAP